MIPLTSAKRIVIKLGTGVLTSGIGELDTARIEAHCRQIQLLRQRGIQVIVVSSGAVGLGMGQLGLQQRPAELSTLQACAAVGQGILTNIWQQCLSPHGITAAQILLTRQDLRAKHRHNAVCNTIERLLAHDVVPIVNENDTVSASEIKFGDNDTLSALVASIAQADQLFILSDVPGLIDMKGSGEVVHYVKKITPEIDAMAEGSNQVTSVGGMLSKLSAIKIAQRAGCGAFIGSGKDAQLFSKLLNAETIGSYFEPNASPIKSHRRWIAIQDHTLGTLTVDSATAEALRHSPQSILAAGVSSCEGIFDAGDVVSICDSLGNDLAHGTVNLDNSDLSTILGLSSAAIDATQPLANNTSSQSNAWVIVHRDNLVLVN